MLTQDCGDILAPYGIMRGANSLHLPRDLCMKMNLSDEASTHAVFTYAANFHHRGGDPKYSMISSHHRIAAIRLIKEPVEHHNPYPDDSTVLAVIGFGCDGVQKQGLQYLCRTRARNGTACTRLVGDDSCTK
jgi:hypothetical protein